MLASRIGDSSGLLGRGVMDHVVTGIGGPHPGGSAERGRSPTARRGDRPAPARARARLRHPGRHRARPVLVHARPRARWRPGRENRLTLHPRRTDAWGVPIAQVDCSLSAADEALAARAARGHARAGARGRPHGRAPRPRAGPSTRWPSAWRAAAGHPQRRVRAGTAIHEVGGAPMGTDPSTRWWTPGAAAGTRRTWSWPTAPLPGRVLAQHHPHDHRAGDPGGGEGGG